MKKLLFFIACFFPYHLYATKHLIINNSDEDKIIWVNHIRQTLCKGSSKEFDVIHKTINKSGQAKQRFISIESNCKMHRPDGSYFYLTKILFFGPDQYDVYLDNKKKSRNFLHFWRMFK